MTEIVLFCPICRRRVVRVDEKTETYDCPTGRHLVFEIVGVGEYAQHDGEFFPDGEVLPDVACGTWFYAGLVACGEGAEGHSGPCQPSTKKFCVECDARIEPVLSVCEPERCANCADPE